MYVVLNLKYKNNTVIPPYIVKSSLDKDYSEIVKFIRHTSLYVILIL